MGFNYNLGDDQMRMINKFGKVSKSNNDEIDRNNPRFDPTTLPLKEQLEWLEEKKAKATEAKYKADAEARLAKPIVRTTLRK